MENMLSHVFFCFVGGDLLVSGGVQVPSDKLRSSYLVMSRQRSGLRISARLRACAHDGVWVFLCNNIYVL